MDEKYRRMVQSFADGIRQMRKDELPVFRFHLGRIVPARLYERSKKKKSPAASYED